MEKYTVLYQKVCEEFGADSVFTAPAASFEELCCAHEREYVEKVSAGKLPKNELRRIGFPWSPEMIERSRRSTGATLAAACIAIKEGRGANLAGGTHHASRARGGGYCVFNDSAVSLKVLEQRSLIKRGLVIDLDVHQGDGTADILTSDPAHFCFSMHGARNYPFNKEKSDLDIALDDDTQDEEYLDRLSRAIPFIFERAKPDIVIYLAGADPFELDQLGRLKLSKMGLAARDAMVVEACDRHGIPLVLSMGGGYAKNISDIVSIHFNTLLIASGQPPQGFD